MKSALIYPAMIMLVVVGVIAVMMIVVVPNLLEIFEDKSALPSTTKALIFMSDIFVNYWYLMIFTVIAGYVSILLWKNTPT
jgi:type IV pilus assembly protein PilC